MIEELQIFLWGMYSFNRKETDDWKLDGFGEERRPIWYIGHEQVVDLPNEELVSKELPILKIRLRRIWASERESR